MRAHLHTVFDTSGTVHTNGTAFESWGVSQQRHEATSAPSYADQMCGADRMRADLHSEDHSDSSSHADSVDPKHVNQVLNTPTMLTVSTLKINNVLVAYSAGREQVAAATDHTSTAFHVHST